MHYVYAFHLFFLNQVVATTPALQYIDIYIYSYILESKNQLQRQNQNKNEEKNWRRQR